LPESSEDAHKNDVVDAEDGVPGCTLMRKVGLSCMFLQSL